MCDVRGCDLIPTPQSPIPCSPTHPLPPPHHPIISSPHHSPMPTQRVTLAHGSGGRMTQQLIRQVFGNRFSNPILDRMNDAAVLAAEG
ncbi:MAG TPA: hypothetical protein ENJ02_12105, partial [Chloroflexi bacterium]|nr:hypothetical protein [Chloroflexota bacterium]